MKYLNQLFVVVLCCFIFSCAQKAPKGKTQAEVLYKEAQEFFKGGRFILANEKLNLLRSQHPYSFYATHAELLQADILFKQENYVESAASYILFRDFHPRNKRMPFVVFRIAESFYNQIPDTFDRDLSPVVESIKYYKEVLQKYSRSEYVNGAREKIEQGLLMLDKKEKYIADFYFKTKVYDAARFRYKSILRDVRNQEIKSHSKQRIVKTSLMLEDYKSCLKYADQFMNTLKDKYKQDVENDKAACIEGLMKKKSKGDKDA